MTPPFSRGWVSLLHRLEETVLVLLMAALILLAFAQIVLRNLFEITWLWTEPLIRHLVLWSGFLGALIATRMDKHIHIDSLFRLLPPVRQIQVKAVTDLVSGLMCGLLTWISLEFLAGERAAGTRSLLDLPTWELQLIFPLTFVLMTGRFLYRSGSRFWQLRKGSSA